MGCSQSKTAEPVQYVAQLPEAARVMIMRYMLTHQVVEDGQPSLEVKIQKLVKKGYFLDQAEAISAHWEQFVGDFLDRVYVFPEHTKLADPAFRVSNCGNPGFSIEVIRLEMAMNQMASHFLMRIEAMDYYRVDPKARADLPTNRESMQSSFGVSEAASSYILF